jgi:uncharacterized protein YjcR
MMKGQTAICGAKTRQGKQCLNIPMKNGRCRMHGGKSTGPKLPSKLRGNQNAVGNKGRLKTGEFETITWERLEDWEKESVRIFYGLKPDDKVLEPLEMEFIRQARMMRRMNDWDNNLIGRFDDLLRLEDAMSRVSGKILKVIEKSIG